MTSQPCEEGDNVVFLRGRLAETAVERELPSGDLMLTFRLTVARPPGGRVRVDSLECVTTRARVRRTLSRAEAGAEVEVHGSLQRRFWRSPAGPASRYAVDVDTARVVRPGRRVAG